MGETDIGDETLTHAKQQPRARASAVHVSKREHASACSDGGGSARPSAEQPVGRVTAELLRVWEVRVRASPVPVQMSARVSPVPVQMWAAVEPSADGDVLPALSPALCHSVGVGE